MDIATDNWSRVKLLFEEALQHKPETRAAFLDQNCSEEDVRGLVQKLLVCHEEASGFLATSYPARAASSLIDTPRSAFTIGNILGSRFRVRRMIARGGMGEVYEAEDLELRGRVAIKVIRPDLLEKPRSLERFKREVQLAKQVTHANVCRVFDLFRHVPERSALPNGDVTYFVSMELLEGETLAERLKRTGRMTPSEALPIVVQVASALDAAHGAGILHRDLKPGNVMLAPGRQGEGVRAVVTDFGLALGPSEDFSSGLTVTGPSEAMGTPAYMSPEQLENKNLTPASDVYALGLMMYEMITGRRPFSAGTPISMALRRLTEPPPSPMDFVPYLSEDWERVILRCLERDPEKRFTKAAHVVAALDRSTVSEPTRAGTLRWSGQKVVPAASVVPRVFGRFALISLILTGTLVTAYLFGFRRTQRYPSKEVRASPPTAVRRPRRTIAVIGIRNASGRPGETWISTALSEMLSTELEAGGQLRTLSQNDVARVKSDLAIGYSELPTGDTIARIRGVLSADLAVSGEYVLLDGPSDVSLRLDVRVSDAAGGVIAAASESGPLADLFEIVSRTGARLRNGLELRGSSREELAGIRASWPANPDAARLYSQGVDFLHSLKMLEARDSFEKAIAAEPDFPLSRLRLAETWSVLGYDEKAKQEAKNAFDLSGTLSQEERLWAEGNYREMAKEWDLAITIYQRLWGFYPDEPDYALQLAGAQVSRGKVNDALNTLDQLRRGQLSESNRARADLAEALASEADPPRELQAARRASSEGDLQNARFLTARATLLESYALADLGNAQEGIERAMVAQRLFAAIGDRIGYARAIICRAMLLRLKGGKPDQRKSLYEEALRVCRQIGNKRCEAAALNNLAGVEEDIGDFPAAQRGYQDCLKVRLLIDDKNGSGSAFNNLGTTFEIQGDLASAAHAYAQALDVYKTIDFKPGEVMALSNLAEVLRMQGNLPEAQRLAQESVALLQEIGTSNPVRSNAMEILADILFRQGDLNGAEKLYRQGIAGSESLGDKNTATGIRVSLAALWIKRNRLSDAEPELRECRDFLRRAQETGPEARAEVGLIEALLQSGKLKEAQREIPAAMQFLSSASGKIDTVPLTIALAQVQAASGDAVTAENKLKDTLNWAKRHGAKEYELELRLALGKIEIESGNLVGRTELNELRSEARTRGFLVVAQEASRALEPRE